MMIINPRKEEPDANAECERSLLFDKPRDAEVYGYGITYIRAH